MSDPEQDILDSWRDNARPWIAAIRNGEIASREQLTNQVIIDAVCAHAPQRLLDVGCGEGWLCRALSQRGIETVGIDAEPALIDAARAAGGQFAVMTYQQLPQWTPDSPFDLLVCNFSLLGKDSVDAVFDASTRLLAPQGWLLIQTLHPDTVEAQQSSWRAGSWDGFSDQFCHPAPWYCRRLDDWLTLYQQHDFAPPALTAPTLPGQTTPASLLLAGQRR